MFPWEEEDGTLDAEIAEGETACLEGIRKGLYFEVGEPFEVVKFNVKKWWNRAPKTRGKITPHELAEGEAELSRRVLPQPTPEPYLGAICAFCGKTHPTRESILKCMDVYWTLHRLKGTTPTKKEVCKYLYREATT